MKGTCLCGAIEVTAQNHHEAGLCHCTTCRRWTGGPMFSVHCGSDVQFSGDAPAVYRSSGWAERGFCAKCGTHLFYHLLPGNEYVLSVGIFQDEPFLLATKIFIDEKPSYCELRNETRKMTGQEVFDQYAPGS